MQHKESAVVFVFNDKNELALQLRAAKDDSYPSHWDFSSAGGIKSGEDPLIAAERELKEEIGIESQLISLGEILYTDANGEDQLYLYKTSHNGPFTLDLNEVDDEKFFTRSEISEMINSGVKFHPEFVFVWNSGLIH